MAWLPSAIPGVLLGVGLLWMLLTTPGFGILYGTIGAMFLALFIKELPLGVNLSSTAFLQVARELELASRVCGANWITTYFRILLPLVAPTIVSLFAVVFISSIRDIGTTVLLVTPSSRSLSLLMFEHSMSGSLESAAIVGIIISTVAVVVATVVRRLSRQFSVY